MATIALNTEALAGEINAAHAECEAAAHTSLQHAMRAGDLLRQVKDGLPHGEWGAWIKQHCTFSERLAQTYMRIARELPKANPQRVADLSVREAVALISKPKAEPAAPPYIPPPGHRLLGELGGGDRIWIEPSAHPGGPYYYITVVQDDGEGGGIVDGTIKPVLADGIPRYLEEWVPTRKLASVTWHAWPHDEPRDYNAWLFADHDAYMRDYVLGGWVAQKVHERARRMGVVA